MENTEERKLIDIINHEIKSAMLAKDALKRDCLRSILSEVKNETVNKGLPITDDACRKVLKKSLKTHGDSIEQFEKAGRHDLAEKEKAELAIIEVLLPRMLNDKETSDAIVKAMVNGMLKPMKCNFGLIMKELWKLPESDRIDRKLASSILKGMLS